MKKYLKGFSVSRVPGMDMTNQQRILIPCSRCETGVCIVGGRAAEAASNIRNIEYFCTTFEEPTYETQQRR
jgi:hypothetical protein